MVDPSCMIMTATLTAQRTIAFEIGPLIELSVSVLIGAQHNEAAAERVVIGHHTPSVSCCAA